MRKIVLSGFAVLLLASCKDEYKKSFTISGTLKNTQAKVVYVEESIIVTGEKNIKDSANIGADGKFSVKIKAKEEGIYNLRLQTDPSAFATIINDTNNIELEADFNKRNSFYDVKGSKSSETIEEYFAKISEMQTEKFGLLFKADSIRKNKGDSLLAESFINRQAQITNEIKSYTQQTVLQANKGSLGLFILATYQGFARNPNAMVHSFSDPEVVGLLNEMLKKFPDRSDIAGLRNSIESQNQRAIAEAPKPKWVGKQAPEISLPDPNGKKISLSSFRGKYVLVDFWASWCGPCRRENPNVVQAYNQFKNKNFTILGVSLDRPGQKDNWLKAIKDDNLTWTHISDLKFWQSEVVPIYEVGSIPYNVLIDPDGTVIAENLRGYALEQKLQEVLK
jgi:peroxiredoxin